ncbi:hypothetical protein C0J52_08662 [Blattella germanica]|nr:hypothetical protein C0J52_08662 [Blattella germanica]
MKAMELVKVACCEDTTKSVNTEIESSVFTHAESATNCLTFETAEIQISATVVTLKAVMGISTKVKSTTVISSSNSVFRMETVHEFSMLKSGVSTAVEVNIKTSSGSTCMTASSTTDSTETSTKTDISTTVISIDDEFSTTAVAKVGEFSVMANSQDDESPVISNALILSPSYLQKQRLPIRRNRTTRHA